MGAGLGKKKKMGRGKFEISPTLFQNALLRLQCLLENLKKLTGLYSKPAGWRVDSLTSL